MDAQERFNPKRGSISPRTDAPKDNFAPFLGSRMDDFANADSRPPSTTHGLAVPPETLTNPGDAMSTFASSWNVAKASTGLSRSLR